MASYEKTKSGSYRAVIYLGRDADGKLLRKFVTRKTLKECKAAAREIELEIEEGRYVDVKNIRMKKWMDKWLDLNKNRLAPSTYLSYKLYVEKHFTPFFGNKKLSQISLIHLQEYMSQKLDTYSISYVRKHMFVLREILEDALQHKSPAQYIELPPPKKFKPHVISPEEFERIHLRVKGGRDEIIVLLAAWCGLRRGEIFALKWNDINWDECMLRVDESRSLSENGYIDKDPKSNNGFRQVAVPQELFDIIKVYRTQQKEIQPRIFSLRPDYFSNLFHSIMVEIGLPKVRFHDLRHYHASWLYSQGIPDHYAAERLGHDISVLKGIYQHLGLKDKLELDEKMKKIR